MEHQPIELTVSEFVAYTNQTLEFAYPSVVIVGEIANFRVSKNRWMYFDLKDDDASVRFFGTVYQLNGPMEDGMMLSVRGAPRLHQQFGFSVTIQQIKLVGEGTIKRASDLLKAKLAKEGLFEASRKRSLPYPPKTIGLITSSESAAYADFVKILNARWSGVKVSLVDVQVQGVSAPEQITEAINRFNQLPEPPEVLVIVRGGGSADDLQAFSDEKVVRGVASSRIPTLVAIGHEIDVSLAELAADMHASTPSNAAELLVPDRQQVLLRLNGVLDDMKRYIEATLNFQIDRLNIESASMSDFLNRSLDNSLHKLAERQALLAAYSPQQVLSRGYALVRAFAKESNESAITSVVAVSPGDKLKVLLKDGELEVVASKITKKEQK